MTKIFQKYQKKSLLSNVETNLSIHVNQKNDDINSNQVFGSGDYNADLVIIGESPGNYEEELGKPYAGSSGKLLDKILKAIGLKRNQSVYLTYILKYKTLDNRDPLLSEINDFLPFLINQIEIIKPKIIVGLGKVVGRATGGDFGFRLNKSIALGMIKPELATTGQKLKIDILGKMHDATILDESPYDPENKLLRA